MMISVKLRGNSGKAAPPPEGRRAAKKILQVQCLESCSWGLAFGFSGRLRTNRHLFLFDHGLPLKPTGNK